MAKRKTITTFEIIKDLKSKGNKITYRKRTDGGYIITQINGIHFKGAAGNKMARAMSGTYLTQAQTSQRIKTTKVREEYYSGIDKDTQKIMRKTQKAWREYKKSGGIQDRSRVSAKQVRRNVKKYGAQKAQEMLIENAKYARHIAYRENVEDLIERVQRRVNIQLKTAKPQDDWSDILAYLQANIDNIHEENQRQKILNVLYDDKNKIHTEKETGNAIRQILNIPLK